MSHPVTPDDGLGEGVWDFEIQIGVDVFVEVDADFLGEAYGADIALSRSGCWICC